MNDMDQEPDVFQLGLTMAGAISAGAYTAGVLDFLFSALAAQEPGEDGVRVVLKTMSGTSAGGVCTALSVPALINGIEPYSATGHTIPILHEIWVQRLDFMNKPEIGRIGLTSMTDLEPGPDGAPRKHVFSLLNSAALDSAAAAVLEDVNWSGEPHDFIASDLDLFLTCTNLNGVPYRVHFSTGDTDAGHLMANHAHVAHFRVRGLGAAPIPSAWLELWKDRGIELDLAPGAVSFDTGAWKRLVDFGVVTGAFPVGLAARQMDGEAAEFGVPDPVLDNCIRGGAWPLDIDPALGPVVAGGGDLVCTQPASFVGVDGGVCNNEPFELARFTLREAATGGEPWALAPNPREPREADRAVIMIDPFPEGPEPDLASVVTETDRAMVPVVAALKTALLDQARFKPGELLAAMDGAGRSRFLIAPSRGEFRGSAAIASGLLGGFGGFLCEMFREHDYQLGRANCQSFLLKHFNLQAPHDRLIRLGGGGGEAREVPILRLRDPLRDEITVPAWPKLPLNGAGETAETLVRALSDRVTTVVRMAMVDGLSGRIGKGLVRVGWSLFGQRKLERMLIRIVGADLIKRNQVYRTEGKPDHDWTATEAEVLSALYAPGPDLRTVKGLARATRLSEAEVKGALDSLIRTPGDDRFRIWKGPESDIDGGYHRVYSVEAFKPAALLRLPFGGFGLQYLIGRLSTDLDPA